MFQISEKIRFLDIPMRKIFQKFERSSENGMDMIAKKH